MCRYWQSSALAWSCCGDFRRSETTLGYDSTVVEDMLEPYFVYALMLASVQPSSTTIDKDNDSLDPKRLRQGDHNCCGGGLVSQRLFAMSSLQSRVLLNSELFSNLLSLLSGPCRRSQVRASHDQIDQELD